MLVPGSSTGVTVPGCRAVSVLAVALALSIGWGVRGNWGHEYGAMIPGALSALAAAIVSGREDWRRRAPYFAFFGALGWSFGGSISYGLVLGYAHSDSLPDVLYGFAGTFLIGFLWGAMGGAATALAASLERRQLEEFFPPLLAIFALSVAWDYLALFGVLGREQLARLNWHGTDWVAAGVALLVGAVASLIAPSLAASLILRLAAGWWLGVLVLVEALDLHLSPPRSDNWAGSLGMTAALLVFLLRRKMTPALIAALAVGLFSGAGFATGLLIRVAGHASGIATNWHSVLEQSFGFIAGLGVAAAMGYLAPRLPLAGPEASARWWTEAFSVFFVVVGITYVNIVKNVLVDPWLSNRVVPERMYGVPAFWWFNAAYLALAALVAALIVAHRRRPLAALPVSALGRAQVLFVVFLWWVVIGNLSRYLPFPPVRLLTEGVIHLDACLVTALLLICPREPDEPPRRPGTGRTLARKLALGALAAGLATALLYTAIALSFAEPGDPAARFRFGPPAAQSR